MGYMATPPPDEFNPRSYDAVLGSIKSELHNINSNLSKLEGNQTVLHSRLDEAEENLNLKISDLDEKVTKKILDVDKKVVALEYFKNYLMGAVALFSTVASYFFTKFFGDSN